MRKTRDFFAIVVALMLGAAGVSYLTAQNVLNYGEQGGSRTVIGGSIDIVSGGDLDIESGGALKIAGSTVLASAAELNNIDGFTGDTADLNFLDGALAGTQVASKAVIADANVNTGVVKATALHVGSTGSETEITATPAELNKLAGVGANAFPVVQDGCVFQANATNTTYTCTVPLPAGAHVQNIQYTQTVLWTNGSAAVLDIGDADDAEGWFIDINVEATDIVLGEVLDISNVDSWGGKQGIYLVAATGRKGQAIATYSGIHAVDATEVIGVILVTGPDSTVGTSSMVVTYAVPTLVSSTNTGS